MSNQIGGADRVILVRLMSMIPNFVDCDSQPILHQIVNRGDKDLVSQIIMNMERSRQLGDFINLKDNEGNTPLHIAVINGYDDIADLLISKGADTQIEDANGNLVIFEKDDSPEISVNINDENKINENSEDVKELISFLVKPEEKVVVQPEKVVVQPEKVVVQPEKVVVQPKNNYIKLNLTPENKKEYERIRDQSPEEVDLDMLKNGFQKGGGKTKPKKSSFGKRFI